MTKGKFFLLLLVGMAAALYFPQSRAYITPYLKPLTNPAYRWMANQEMNQIVEDLRRHEQTRGVFPSRHPEFEAWLRERYPQERSRVDPWGTGYRLEPRGETFRVISAGPDGEFGTEDDLFREGFRERRR